MSGETLDRHRAAWERKAVLRLIYEDFFGRMAAQCGDGPTLEVGSGTGWLKRYLPEVYSSDIQAAPWIDVVADAQALPFADGAFGNIVMMDVLHHLAQPLAFFHEAARVLRPGGRLVLLEPAITPASHLFYSFLHPEPVRMDCDPFAGEPVCGAADPYDANQAVPTLMLVRHAERLAREVPLLSLKNLEWLSLAAYPLSGGFRPWSLIPAALTAPLLRLEAKLAPWVGRLAAFRLLATLERLPG
jgi:SAM-dependent methyltransferase